MCVIIVKPSGVEAPDIETLRACYDTNPDGFGMAIADGQTVTIDKGYMDWPSVLVATSIVGAAGKDCTVIYHFRLATSGLVDGGACHPYPVTDNSDLLRVPHLDSLPCAVAHNGVLGKGSPILNDTQLWVKYELSRLINARDKTFNIETYLKKKAKATSSRFALLYGDGKYILAGDWTERQGLWFSNLHWTWSMERDPIPFATGDMDYDAWFSRVADGYAPSCPGCGGGNTVAHWDSSLALCECYDCLSVFDGMTGDIYKKIDKINTSRGL